MYAVLTTGGKQYRVEAGSTLVVEKLVAEPGSSVTFDRILLIGDGESVTVGTPVVAGASVQGTVLGEELGEEIVIFKFKQKVKYRRRTGHRQQLTRVRIDAISADGKTVTAEVPEKAPRTRRGRAETAGEAEAKAPAKPARRSRSRAAAPAEAPEVAEEPAKAEEPEAQPEKKTRARARTTSVRTQAAEADTAEKTEKPRARRSARSKAETAKEE
jgi:large subunit ribosomal protein L21